ncbi:MAG: discoidin domain-containing protein, partial [bacterium]|nr:discoidin domain-containing protein [bacterium]
MSCLRGIKRLFNLVVGVLLLASLSIPAGATLIAHYGFEGNASDQFGLNNGVVNGNPTYQTGYKTGTTGQAVELDGDGDYVDCGNAEAFDFRARITVACWIKVAAFDKPGQAILVKGDGAWRLERNGTAGTLAFVGSGLTSPVVTGATSVDDHRWHHVAGVYNGASLALYVDGKLDGEVATSGPLAVTGDPFQIGASAGARTFAGRIDDVCVYSTALTAGEIYWLMRGFGTPHNGPHNAPCTIEAEDFNDGGNGDAYDTPAAGNAGDAMYRTETDIDVYAGATGRYVKPGDNNNDYVSYTFNVAVAGWYRISINARNQTQGQWISVYPSVNDKRTPDARYIFWGSAGSAFRDFVAVSRIYLSAGAHVMTLNLVHTPMDFDYLKIASIPAPATLNYSFVTQDEEVIAASAVVTDPPYGVDKTGAGDATAAIQAAIDDVASWGGGVVYAPAGLYKILGNLTLKTNVALIGEWRPYDAGGNGAGTILMAYAGRGDAAAAPFISSGTNRSTAMRNLSIWYPEQTPGTITPYPWTIDVYGGAQLTNLTLYNSYNAIQLNPVNGDYVSDIRGTALNQGVYAPNQTEFAWMNRVHFDPSYWQNAAAPINAAPPTPADRAAINQFVWDNLLGLLLGRIDGMVIYDFNVAAARTPILIDKPDWVEQHDVFGYGGVAARLVGQREEIGWDPWYYWMHYANLDNVPQTDGKTCYFAHPRRPARTDPDSFFVVTDSPYLAAGDGSRDDTASIQAALDDAGARGGGTVFLPQGQYRIDTHLTVPSGVELRGPLGMGMDRQQLEVCSLLAFEGRETPDPDTAAAFITLMDHAGARGFTILYPEQSYGNWVKSYPYTIRGAGAGVWVVAVHLLNSYNGIDLATHRCDDHLVQDQWGTIFHDGLKVGGGSVGGKLEHISYSIGPWMECQRKNCPRVLADRWDIMQSYTMAHSTFFLFGDSTGESTYGLSGFVPYRHMVFYPDAGGGCRDADFWLTEFDVADDANVRMESGVNVNFRGFFGTGSGHGLTNWLETTPSLAGPVSVSARTIQPPFYNHPMPADGSVTQYIERSLATLQPVSATGSLTPPVNAVDLDEKTQWEAGAGGVLTVDLGQPCELNRWTVHNAGLYAAKTLNTYAANVQLSMDGAAYAQADAIANNTACLIDRPLAPVRARFVRLRVTQGGNGAPDDHIRVNE